MRDWLDKLEPKERMMLIVGSVVLLLLLIYMLVLAPMRSAYQSLRLGVAEQRDTVAWMQVNAQTVQRLRSSAGSAPQGLGGRSLLAVTDSTARAGGLGDALKRVEPEGSNSVRVWLDGASFDVLIKWLATLSTRHGVDADSVTLERSEVAGLVNARLTLEAAP